jgi:polysaccharide pyruvyl transferase WcaK-like protein
VPDPGFHVNLDIEYPQIEKDKYVIIQLANDKPEYRFGDDRIIDIISSLRSIIKELAKKYKVILAPHVYDDIDLCKKVSNNIKNVSIWNFGYYAFDHAIESISYYKYAEFAIAMRGHGQIVPFAFNTPIISIENHPKHKGLMDELELSEYNINIYDQYFYDNIMKAIYNIERNKDRLIYHYKSMNNKMLEITNQNMSNIKMQLLYK